MAKIGRKIRPVYAVSVNPSPATTNLRGNEGRHEDHVAETRSDRVVKPRLSSKLDRSAVPAALRTSWNVLH
jgi:hypothetical protein